MATAVKATTLRNSPPSLLKRLTYQTIGPTINHLGHELVLFVSLTLILIASSQSLYQDDHGLPGDYQFTALAALWLSRHLLIRWICVWDPSTSRCPTPLGVVSHWLNSHVMAGQFFDRPPPQVVARQLGLPQTDGRSVHFSWSNFLLPSILYTGRLFKVWLWHPLVKALGVLSRLLGVRLGLPPELYRRRDELIMPHVNTAYRYWHKFWTMYGPPLQMLIPLATMTFYVWHLLFDNNSAADAPLSFTSNQRSNSEMGNFDTSPFGAYRKTEKPTLGQMLFVLSCSGTISSILVLGRVILPVPSAVAGSNVLKAVRNEARLYGSQSSGAKSSKTKFQKENQDVPWLEQYKSIVAENRFRLTCKVAFIRIVEAVFICAVLPRTRFLCHATGHCPEGTPMHELTKVLFPAGITTTLREDGSFQDMFASLPSDHMMTVVTTISVMMVSMLLLLTQASSLNRSYLAIMGYIAGEWALVSPSEAAKHAATLSQWDPRRRYKKGDMIVQNFPGFGGQTVYKATSNSPEGCPFDLHLRATHGLFRNELGHPSTSNLVSVLAKAHISFIGFLLFLSLVYKLTGWNSAQPVLMLVLANLLAACGMLECDLFELSELEQLSKELST